MTERRGSVALVWAAALSAFFAGAAAANAQDITSAPPLTLKQAVTRAIANSADVKVARMQYNVARAQVGMERANFLPNLFTGSGAAYTSGFPSLPGGNAPALFQLNYQETLFNPALKSQQHAAEERAKSAKLEADRIQDDVIARTATAYLELAKVRHSRELLETEQASAEKIIAVTQQRVAANQELPIEETRGELALAEVNDRLVKLENRDAILSRQIRDMTGMTDDAALEVEQNDEAIPGNLLQRPDNAIVGLALQNDRGIAEAENDQKAKQELLRGARWSYFPTVDLVGQYSLLSRFNNYDQFYKTFERNNLSVGVQVTIPIFSARTGANATLAKNELQASDAALEAKRQQVRQGAEEQQQDLRVADADREVARLTLSLAQQTLGLEQAKMQQGQATLADVERAQLDESEKFVEFLDADFAHQKAEISLLQTTGQLAQVFQ